MKRKIVEVEVHARSVDDYWDILDGNTFDQVITAMETLKAEFKGRDIFFKLASYGYEGVEIRLIERREETNKEFARRLATEKRNRELREIAKAKVNQRELDQYLKLKRKFEGK